MEKGPPGEVDHVQTQDGRPFPKKVEIFWWLKTVAEIVEASSLLEVTVLDVMDVRRILDPDKRYRIFRRAVEVKRGFAEAERDWHDSLKKD